MSKKIRIAVVDRFPIMRDGIVQVLQREGDMEVVATGATAHEAAIVARELKPDILILDVAIPGDGITAIRTIGEMAEGPKIIVLSLVDKRETVAAAMNVGARGYILKGVSGPELVRGVRLVHEGQIYLSRDLNNRPIPKKNATFDSTCKCL